MKMFRSFLSFIFGPLVKGSSIVTQKGNYALKVSRPKRLVRIFYLIFLGKWKSRYESYDGMRRAVLLRKIANHILAAFGIGSVFAEAYGVMTTADGKPALIIDWIEGRTPSKEKSREFLARVEAVLFEAGLPTWSVSSKNPRAWEDVRIVDGKMICLDYESQLPGLFSRENTWAIDPVDFELLADALDVAAALAYENLTELEELYDGLEALEGEMV